MAQSKAHLVWIEQCKAVQTIKARFGLKAAFEYIVGEKLLNFAEVSAHNSDFARELPRFVSEVRSMFPPDEVATQLLELERAQNEKDKDSLEEEDDPLGDSPGAATVRLRRFNLMKELLTATTLGTS